MNREQRNYQFDFLRPQHSLFNYFTKLVEQYTKVFIIFGRAYPGSEVFVANTLAKWKKLEPNDINSSQGFSQKVVSTSCFVFNSLPTRADFYCLFITFANNLEPDQARQNVGPDLDPNSLSFRWY